MGPIRGPLATALDMLTDALVMEQIEDSKGLIIGAMELLKKV